MCVMCFMKVLRKYSASSSSSSSNDVNDDQRERKKEKRERETREEDANIKQNYADHHVITFKNVNTIETKRISPRVKFTTNYLL